MKFLTSALHNYYDITDSQQIGLFGQVTEPTEGYQVGEIVNIISLLDILAPVAGDLPDCRANLYVISSLDEGSISLANFDQVCIAHDFAKFEATEGENWLLSNFFTTKHIPMEEAISIAVNMGENGVATHTYTSPSLDDAVIVVKATQGGYLFTEGEDTLAFIIKVDK